MAKDLLLDRPPIWSGLDYIVLTPVLARALNSPSDEGILIQRVAYGSLGDKLGLQPGRIAAKILGRDMLLGGDLVLTIGGLPVKHDPASVRYIIDYLSSVKESEPVAVEVFRDGKIVELTATR
jgi:serine protease Do